MKKIILLIVLVGVGTAAYVQYGSGDTDEAATVTRAPVSTGGVVQAVQAIGTLQPIRSTRVGSQVSGTVKALYVDFNSTVKKDQLLMELDPSLLEVQVAVQEANLARQENDIAQQRVMLTDDQRNLERAQAGYDRGLVTLQQLENAKLQVKNRTAQIASAEKTKIQTEAQLRQAQLNVSYCTIRSPVDGVILQRMVDVGQVVQARVNSPMFFFIAESLTTLRLQAGVDEADIGRVRPGMLVTFTVESFKGQTFMGRVESVRLNAQNVNSVVTYPVWIEVQNEDLMLRPGMTANLQIVVDSVDNATLVSNDALKFRTTSDTYAWLELPPPTNVRAVRLTAPEMVPIEPNPSRPSNAEARKIDDLFAPFPKRITSGQVWVYDEANSDPAQRLRPILLRLGISDGQVTEVISGDVRPGLQLVTSVVPPPSFYERRSGGLFSPQQGRRGGMTPGEPQGPSRLQPRGGRPAGGGGGRGR